MGPWSGLCTSSRAPDTPAFGTDAQIVLHPFPVRVADRAVAFVQNPPRTEVMFRVVSDSKFVSLREMLPCMFWSIFECFHLSSFPVRPSAASEEEKNEYSHGRNRQYCPFKLSQYEF